MRQILECRNILQMIREKCDRYEESTRQLAGIAMSEYLGQLLSSGKYTNPLNLNRHEYQVFSRHGQDGILSEIFRRIGHSSRYFVEVGAGYGTENNTAFWLMQGWEGCWVEGGNSNACKIRSQFHREIASGQLTFSQSMITAENIEQVFRDHQVPEPEFDLLSIDIDRNTYWAWKAIKNYRPRVVVIEYNSLFRPPMEWVVEYDANRGWNGTTYFGASLKSYEILGRELGYYLVGCELVGADAFFVRKDLCGDKFQQPFSAELHYEPPRHFLWPNHEMLHTRCIEDR